MKYVNKTKAFVFHVHKVLVFMKTYVLNAQFLIVQNAH